MSCAGCDEKARGHAELDQLAQVWIAAGKLRGFVEGVEWTVKAIEHLAPQLARASLRERLFGTEALVRGMGPSILERVALRKVEAQQAESAARTMTSSARMPPASRRGVRQRLRAALLAALG